MSLKHEFSSLQGLFARLVDDEHFTESPNRRGHAVLQLMVPAAAALAGALGGALVALAVARMHIKAEQSARIWQARKTSYTVILRTLKDASEKANVVDYGYNSGEDGRGPHDYFGSERRPEDESAAGSAWTSCKEAYDADCLILSERFRDRFNELLRSLPTGHDQYDPPEDAERWAACLGAAYRDLFRLAHRECFPSR